MQRALVCILSFLLHSVIENIAKPTFLQALRSRTIPATLNSREIIALQSWRVSRKLQQNRLKSSIQHAREVDELTPAILHGGQRLQKSGLQPEESLRNTSQPSQALSRTSQKGQISGRREEQSSTAGPAQRWRLSEPRTKPTIELKDENYVRSHMHVPNALDYPELPPKIFESPKSAIFKAFDGSGQLKSESSRIEGRRAFRCILKCNINRKREVCFGESQSQVLFFDRQSLNIS